MNLLLVLVFVVAVYLGNVLLFLAAASFFILRVLMRLWVRRAAADLHVERRLDRHVFFGERATVHLDVGSGSALPLPWLHVREHVPLSLAAPSVISHALTLRPRERVTISYELIGRQRGLHQIGPLQLSAGDVFGLARRELEVQSRSDLIVFPRLLQAHELDLHSLALFGDVRSRRRIIGDPARMRGVREYAPGDPLHDIHWRATAATGALQVKHYEPTTSLRTMIFLDLAHAPYERPGTTALAELAISAAATVAVRLVEQRQEVGLATTGCVSLGRAEREQSATPAADGERAPGSRRTVPTPLAPARGRAHLLHLLEILACLEPGAAQRLDDLLMRHALGLPWGSTLLIVTAQVQEQVFVCMHRMREAGLLVVVLCVGEHPDRAALAARARALGARLEFLSPAMRREAVGR